MALATTALPSFVVFSGYGNPGCVYYKNESEIVQEEVSVWDPLVKIAVEPANIDNTLINLRFCGRNRYWAKDADGWIVANSDQPDENESSSTCTLFRVTFGQSNLFFLNHVQSGGRVQISDSGPRLYVNPDPNFYHNSLDYLNWESLVKLPSHVAFKGDNGQYLKGVSAYDHGFLQFSSDDPNKVTSGYEIQLIPDGHVRIKSDYFNKFWIRSTDSWIWADSSDGGDSSDKNTLFWPIKIDDNTIALRNEGNGKFCKRYSKGVWNDDLNAAADNNADAKIGVQELVLDRKVNNVNYQMEYARVYGVKPYEASTITVVNNGDEETSISVTITYKDDRSFSFSKSVSLTAGVTTIIEADLPEIEKGSVQISKSSTGTYEWNVTNTITTSIPTAGAFSIPAKSTAVVRYVGLKGTCDVPFSYTQTAISSTDGSTVETEETDGTFIGVNSYDFKFEIDEPTSL